MNARADRLTLGTKEWKTSYGMSCAAGLGQAQVQRLSLCTEGLPAEIYAHDMGLSDIFRLETKMRIQ